METFSLLTVIALFPVSAGFLLIVLICKIFIDFPTPSEGHVLDLICCSGVLLQNCVESDLSICDHKLLSFNVTLISSASNYFCSVAYCDIKDSAVSAFFSGVDSLPRRDNLSTPDELCQYNNGLQSFLHLLFGKLGLSLLFTLLPGSPKITLS